MADIIRAAVRRGIPALVAAGLGFGLTAFFFAPGSDSGFCPECYGSPLLPVLTAAMASAIGWAISPRVAQTRGIDVFFWALGLAGLSVAVALVAVSFISRVGNNGVSGLPDAFAIGAFTIGLGFWIPLLPIALAWVLLTRAVMPSARNAERRGTPRVRVQLEIADGEWPRTGRGGMPLWMMVVGIVVFVHGLSLVSYVLFGYLLVQPHFLPSQLVVPTALAGFGLLCAALRIRLQERIVWYVALIGLAWSALVAGIVIADRLSLSSRTASVPEVTGPDHIFDTHRLVFGVGDGTPGPASRKLSSLTVVG